MKKQEQFEEEHKNHGWCVTFSGLLLLLGIGRARCKTCAVKEYVR